MSLERSLHRRRWVRGGIFSLFSLAAASVALDRAGVFGHRGDDWRIYDRRTFVVSRVVDGDTVCIRLNNGEDQTKIRLLGVDAPELYSDSTGLPDFWAERAKNYLADRLMNKPVTLRLEPTQTRDRYDRLLAYLFLTDADNLNLELIRDGQVYADRRFNHTFRPQFELAEIEARKKGRGLWQEVEENQMPPWRRQWLNALRERK